MTRPNIEAFARLGRQMQADVDAILPPAQLPIDVHLCSALVSVDSAIHSMVTLDQDYFAFDELQRIAKRLRTLIELYS